MLKGGSKTLKMAGRLRMTTIVTTTLAVTAFASLLAAGSAFADNWKDSGSPATLSGEWAPFNRCPIDDPRMLAADGSVNIALCAADYSPNGSLTISKLTVPTKGTNHQFGLVNENGSFVMVEPAGTSLVDEPIEFPNGLQGLICPSSGHFWRHICRDHHDGYHHYGYHHDGWDDDANAVTMTIESAGGFEKFNFFAGLALEVPFGLQPVKIHVQNELLGRSCYIGTDEEPIVLQPQNITQPSFEERRFAANGTAEPEGALGTIRLSSNQAAGAFAVPAASGCGFGGFFDQAIDRKIGLPSPAGANSLVFNEATTSVVGVEGPSEVAPNDGADLSKYWHSAVVPSHSKGGGHHEFDHGSAGGDHQWSQHELKDRIRRWLGHGH